MSRLPGAHDVSTSIGCLFAGFVAGAWAYWLLNVIWFWFTHKV